MDQWLRTQDIDTLIAQLNHTLPLPKDYDQNWEALKRERANPFLKCVRTQSPALMLFEKHQGFVYRRWDGAHWHTELRNLSEQTAFTPAQAQLRDSLQTVCAVGKLRLNLQWYTPVHERSYDPRYQLIHTGTEWWCVIDNCVYAESTRRQPENRGYTEVRFSTRKSPVFTPAQLASALDALIKPKTQ